MTKVEERGEEKNRQKENEPICGSGFAGLKFSFMRYLGDLAGPR
jgi:hypothetical protein